MSTRRSRWFIVCIRIFVFTANIGINSGINCSDGSVLSALFCDMSSREIPTESPPINAGCILPNIKNGSFVNEVRPEIVLKPGDRLPHSGSIIYKCEQGYKLDDAQYNYCLGGKWMNSHPACIKYCPNNILHDITFKVNCHRNGFTVSCDDPIRPGTWAHISCQVNYIEPISSIPDKLFCNDDGQWDSKPLRCEPLCGELVTTEINQIDGKSTTITLVPWHASIYKTEEYHCGGTILSAKVVISTASCYWDKDKNKFFEKSLFDIGAGKHFGDFGANDPKAQFRKIYRIIVPPSFNFETLQNNIAMVVLESPLYFTLSIAPVCLEWMSEKQVADNTFGRILNYGGSNENNSILTKYNFTSLKTTKSIKDCDQKYQGIDMFCATIQCEPGFCLPFFGSGFTLQNSDENEVKHYIYGIEASTTGKKDSKKFVNIQFYEEFVKENLQQ